MSYLRDTCICVYRVLLSYDGVREPGDPSDRLDTLPELDGGGGGSSESTSGGQVPSLQYLAAIWDGLITILAGLIVQQVGLRPRIGHLERSDHHPGRTDCPTGRLT